jgi:uncharacterized membrane protein YozB (DUF420 family)
MLSVTDLPTLNALLNTTSFLLLISGYLSIRRGKNRRHRNFMVAALTTSALFLGSYLVYHYQVGSKPFQGQGVIRPIYFSILLSHTVLAMAIVPMVGVTFFRALRESFEKHRKIARWTLPLWLYVSITGVLIYLLLYVF